MTAEIRLVPCLSDNYAVILRDPASGVVALVDAPDAAPIERALAAEQWKLTHILVTHHHGDHVQGIPALKQKFGAKVIGPRGEATKIPGLDQAVGEGDKVAVGGIEARVLETPGHTAGHIVYVLDAEKLLFAGDTLFSIGCGRVIEGTPEQMWNSLLKLRALPDDVRFYCGHEYTEANIRFASSIEPYNEALVARAAEAQSQRAAGQPTLPATIGQEKAANPFLRADVPSVAVAVGCAGKPPAEVFAEIRARKNSFRG